MILTTKKIAKDYGIKESKVRKLLRNSDIPKVQEGYFWWIDEQYQPQLDKLFKAEGVLVNEKGTATEIIKENENKAN